MPVLPDVTREFCPMFIIMSNSRILPWEGCHSCCCCCCCRAVTVFSCTTARCLCPGRSQLRKSAGPTVTVSVLPVAKCPLLTTPHLTVMCQHLTHHL